ncbi:MAG: Eco47II family restriction endonuclease [Burkholderiales bacterium]|nr:Eco47II family restriction endonuclease [Burkholderiales bacterium]
MLQNNKYNLSFISDIDLLHHVKETVQKYSFVIDLKKFNKNIVDPIKLTFDKLIYKKTIAELIDSEVIRQIDKSNNNTIGYFHQNIFNYIGGNDWIVPKN